MKTGCGCISVEQEIGGQRIGKMIHCPDHGGPSRLSAAREGVVKALEALIVDAAEVMDGEFSSPDAIERADRLSAAREGVVKALEGALEEVPTCLHPHCPIIDGYDQWCCAIGPGRAALKEWEEASK